MDCFCAIKQNKCPGFFAQTVDKKTQVEQTFKIFTVQQLIAPMNPTDSRLDKPTFFCVKTQTKAKYLKQENAQKGGSNGKTAIPSFHTEIEQR